MLEMHLSMLEWLVERIVSIDTLHLDHRLVDLSQPLRDVALEPRLLLHFPREPLHPRTLWWVQSRALKHLRADLAHSERAHAMGRQIVGREEQALEAPQEGELDV